MNQDTVSGSGFPVGVQASVPAHHAGQPSRPALRLALAGSADRVLLEGHIADRFARQYGARVDHFLPMLLCLDLAGRPGAVAGLRPASRSALFLETYLDVPVEQAVSRCFRQPVDRAQVIEIGNLVSLLPGAATMLFSVLPLLLEDAGVRWVTCTATPQVRAMLGKLGFESRAICVADPATLGEQAGAWGSYYASRPVVIAGDVRMAARRARRSHQAVRVQRLIQGMPAPLSAVIRNARR